jgi:hypothetical protein
VTDSPARYEIGAAGKNFRGQMAKYFQSAFLAVAIMGPAPALAAGDATVLAIPARFADALPFAEGYAPVKLGPQWGYINSQGSMVVQPVFDEVSAFSGKMAAARLGSKWGYIDPDGVFQLAPNLDYASGYSHGFSTFGVVTGGAMNYGVMNTHWDLVTLPRWGEKLDFSEGPAVVRTANGKPYRPGAAPQPVFKFGYINLDGDYIIPPKFEGGLAFRNGLAAVETGGKWGYVDFDGKMIIPPQFNAGGFFGDDLAAEPGENAKFGYIDRTGHFTIPARFDEARPFSEGFAAVRIADKWGYIDKNGNLFIAPQFADARAFGQGLAPVRVGDLWGYVGNK